MTEYIDQQRASKNFLTTAELVDTVGERNSILDTSVLIGKNAVIGASNTFYPGVVIEQQGDGKITIGDGNVFYPGTYFLSTAGEIIIGDNNEFGPAGVTIKANMPDALIAIADNGRYCDGVSIMGRTTLSMGSQILGNIIVQSCTLAGGGDFQEPDPDKRAAVLKGFGLARNIALEVGQVVNGAGDFATFPIEQQSSYHPKTKH